jgi:hypothetical protein
MKQEKFTVKINNDDNVGDSIGKYNFNFLSLETALCNLEQDYYKKRDNYTAKFKRLEQLTDKLDSVLPFLNYNDLQKMSTTVTVLSSYWNEMELSVLYPINLDGASSALTVDSLNLNIVVLQEALTVQDQERILAEALVSRKLFKTVNDAIEGMYASVLLYVKRNIDKQGEFVSWGIINGSNFTNLKIDFNNNFYYEAEAVDIYKIPYFSVIVPTNYTNQVAEGANVLEPNFENKTANVVSAQTGKRVNLAPSNNSISGNTVLLYGTTDKIPTRTQRNNAELYELFLIEAFGSTNFLSIQNSSGRSLATYIPSTNPDLAKTFRNLEVVKENNQVIQTVRKFLSKNYKPQNYRDGTTINVIFMLFNAFGDNTANVNIMTYIPSAKFGAYKLEKNENIRGFTARKTAKNSNTDYRITFSKQDQYIKRIFIARFQKKSRQIPSKVKVKGIIKNSSSTLDFWEFLNIIKGNIT